MSCFNAWQRLLEPDDLAAIVNDEIAFFDIFFSDETETARASLRRLG